MQKEQFFPLKTSIKNRRMYEKVFKDGSLKCTFMVIRNLMVRRFLSTHMFVVIGSIIKFL